MRFPLQDKLWNPGSQLLPWKPFSNGKQYGLLHLPTSTIIQVEKSIFESFEPMEPSGVPRTIPLEVASFLQRAHEALGPGTPLTKEPINIVSIALNVEESCNLRCTYCYAGDGNYGHDSTMHSDLAIKAVESLSKGKKRFHIAFFGGEPLLNFPLIKEVVAWCEQNKETSYTFGMTTNATLLNSTQLKFLKDHAISIKISYDGDKAQAKQRLLMDKKQNAAALVKKKMIKFKDELEELNMSIRATISKNAVHDFADSIEGILSDFSAKLSYSKVASSDISQSIDEQDVELLGDALSKTVHSLIEKKDFKKLLRITNIAASLRIIHRGYVNRMTCGAGIGYMSVSTKGEYFLCHRFTESAEEKIGDVRSGLDLKKLEQFQDYRSGNHAPCNTCWMQKYCRGGCFQENKLKHGSWFEPSVIFCRLQEIELSLALEAYLAINAEDPKLLESL